MKKLTVACALSGMLPIIAADTWKGACACRRSRSARMRVARWTRCARSSATLRRAANMPRDDWRPVRFGMQDRAPVFVQPELSEVKSIPECTLAETR